MRDLDVSIVITTYNYANYIDNCLCSCLNQQESLLNYEVIVVDDGSTDNTADKIKKWLAKYSDSILRYIRIENSGIEKASNIGVCASRGKFVTRVDADDVLKENYLNAVAGYINENVAFLYADYALINEVGKVIENISLPRFDVDEIQSRGDFLATGTLYNAEVIKSLGGYSTEVRNCGLENYELILKLLNKGYRGLHIPQELFFYRRHGANISVECIDEIVTYGCRIFEKNNLGDYTTNQYHPYGLRLS